MESLRKRVKICEPVEIEKSPPLQRPSCEIHGFFEEINIHIPSPHFHANITRPEFENWNWPSEKNMIIFEEDGCLYLDVSGCTGSSRRLGWSWVSSLPRSSTRWTNNCEGGRLISNILTFSTLHIESGQADHRLHHCIYWTPGSSSQVRLQKNLVIAIIMIRIMKPTHR